MAGGVFFTIYIATPGYLPLYSHLWGLQPCFPGTAELATLFYFAIPKARNPLKRPALPGVVTRRWEHSNPTSFLLLAFRPCPKPVKSPRNQCLSKPGRHCPDTALAGAGPCVFPTQPCKPRHGATQGPTGGDEWQRKSAPRFAMHSGLAFIFLSSVPDIDFVAVPISGLIQSKSSICSYPQHR